MEEGLTQTASIMRGDWRSHRILSPRETANRPWRALRTESNTLATQECLERARHASGEFIAASWSKEEAERSNEPRLV